MVTRGTAEIFALRTLAGSGERTGLRLLAVGLVVLVGLVLWGLLVFAWGAGWSRTAQVLATLLVAGLTGAACYAVVGNRQGWPLLAYAAGPPPKPPPPPETVFPLPPP